MPDPKIFQVLYGDHSVLFPVVTVFPEILIPVYQVSGLLDIFQIIIHG